jgi:hypothetical protein
MIVRDTGGVMKILANWHLPVAFALGAIFAVAGSRLIERRPSGEATAPQEIVRAPDATAAVRRVTLVMPIQRGAKRPRRARVPPLLARPATSAWPPPAEFR